MCLKDQFLALKSNKIKDKKNYFLKKLKIKTLHSLYIFFENIRNH